MTFASTWQDYSFGEARGSALPNLRRALLSVHDHFIPHERNNYHPHILGHQLLGLLSMLMVAVKFASIAVVAFSPAATTFSSAITSANIVSLTNQSRASAQLAPLSANAKLAQAAQAKANDMAAKGYFAHTSPDGRSPWSFIQAAGYYYMTAGENLAVDFTQAESVSSAWMNSAGHRANILNGNYTEIGIGIAQGEFQGHNTTFVVQMFGAPAQQNIAFQPAPTQVAPASAPVAAAPAPTPAPVQSATTKPTPAPTPVTKVAAKPVTKSSPSTTLAQAPSTEIVAPESSSTAQPVVNAGVVEILDTSTTIEGDHLVVFVTTAGPASRVVADYNGAAILLDPKSNTQWQGSIPLASLSKDVTLTVVASDIAGNSEKATAASFSEDIASNYNLFGAVKGAAISVMGLVFDPKVVEQKFYLLMMSGLLACLILAIAIRRHIQHLSLVANSSFVIGLSALLWMAG